MRVYKDITVQLTGEDGNAYHIIGLVRRALRTKHGEAAAKAWADYAMASDSYDQLLARAQETVNVV